MAIASEVCYECGRGIPEGLSQPIRACVGVLPGGVKHWAWVDLCPRCVRELERQRRLRDALIFMLVALLTSILAFPLMP
jgi:hypothetical protein